MKIENVKKLVINLHDKKEYVIHILSLKQELNYRLMSKKVLRVIELSQKVWLKPYMDMKTELGKIEKNDFQKHFLS